MEHIKIRFGDHIETRVSEEKSFEEMFQAVNPLFCFSKRIWKPQMDIFETRTQILIQAAISGVKKEDIIVEVSNKAVKITGVRHSHQLDRTTTYRLAEIQFGQFERVLYLPSIIDVTKVAAIFSNGFLELSLGKLLTKNIKSRKNVSLDFI